MHLERMHNDSPLRRLEILAEIYRRARKLWPATGPRHGLEEKASLSIHVNVHT